MAGPEDWGAVPAQESDGPAAWRAQPALQDNGGMLGTIKSIPADIAALATPEGRAAWEKVPAAIAKSVYGTLKDFFTLPGEAAKGEVSPDQEIERSFNAAQLMAGGEALGMPRLTEAVAPVAKAFDDGVAAPAAVRLDAYARTGDPNGVRLEPPAPETKPTLIRPIEGSPFGNIPRSVAARTSVPEIDAVLGSPVTRAVIDNPVIDRSHDIPYMAGASDPINNPTVFIDRHVPQEMTVGGVTFDPADPWTVHENVEQHVMQVLTDAGMNDQAAYRVAHFDFAEPAEHAWYRAHGIDQEAAEAQQAKWLPRIQHEPTTGDVPASLYKKPYPHDRVPGIDHEPVTETPPTPDESARGAEIIRDWAAKQVTSAQPMLQEARELDVIGPDRKPINEVSPREAAQRAIAAQRAPDEKLTMTPQQTAWRQRWEATLDKMSTTDDVRHVIGAILDQNDEFQPARQGDMRPAQVEQLAEVTGLDSTKIDVAGTSAKIKTDAEMRNITEAFRTINDKLQKAAQESDAETFMKLEWQRDLLLESTTATKGLVALRAEFGRAGNRLQEFYQAQREAAGMKEFLSGLGRTEQDVNDRMRMIADTPPNALPKVLEATRDQKPGWLFWMWQQGLISGLVTHTKYLFVNTGTTYLERVIAPEVAAIIGRARGQNVSLMAPIFAHVGMIRALPDALTSAVEAFKTGLRVPLESELRIAERGKENPEAMGAKTPYTQNVGPEWNIWKRVFNERQLDKAAKVLGIPGKSANAIHTFYKVLNERASATTRAYEAAFQDGAKGDEFWHRYDYHLANPTDEALKAAVDDAYSGAFMEKLGVETGKWAAWARGNQVFKWLFPFQHIPLNIERMTIRYSPFAVLGPEMRAALMGEKGEPARNLAIAKVVVGSTIMGYFIDKGLSGTMTGDYPTDPKERREWQLMGKQPNSVQMDGQWVGVERLGPPGNLARLGGNIASIIQHYNGQDDEALTKLMWSAATAAVNQIGDEVGFQTLRNIIDAFENPRHAARFMAWEGSSLLPYSSMLSQSASIIDPQMRVANDLAMGLKYRIPFLRETESPKRDPLYGEPVPNPGYHTVLRESPVNTDPVKAELDRIQYYPTVPQHTIGGVKLDDEQYDRYEATAGPLVKQMLQGVINSQRYKSLSVGQQRAMVKGIIAYARAKSRAAMLMDEPQLMQQGIDQRKAQIAGRPQ